MTKILYSGGAKGADRAWSEAAVERGYAPMHFSFAGHQVPPDLPGLHFLTQEQLRQANPHCARAGEAMKRKWPPKHDYTRKLLQRNWWQVRTSSALYAVAALEAGTNNVTGGTAWAVQMFINANFVGKPLRAYVFDQFERQWYQYTGSWTKIDQPPEPPEVFTGIGSRDLVQAGFDAIRTAWN